MERRASTQDVTWFLDLHKTEQLNLDPPYQRRSVWSLKDRRFFLDTIFRGYPSPAIYLHKEITIGGKTIYNVVDGKQRLETIIRFAKNKIAIDKDYGDTRYNGKKWNDLQIDQEIRNDFWNYVLPVEFISVDEGTSLVNEVFDRLNRNSRKLVEQELRHARYDGWFITFVENESDSHEWETLRVATRAKTKRMKVAQNLSELLIVLLKGEVNGFSQDEINRFYAEYEDTDDLESDFDEDETRKTFDNAKKYLVCIEKENCAVTTYARDFKDLYSLWGLIVLNLEKLPEPSDFAVKYSDFMGNVNDVKERLKAQKDIVELSQKGLLRIPAIYYQNNIGANTDLPQRRARHEALKEVLLS